MVTMWITITIGQLVAFVINSPWKQNEIMKVQRNKKLSRLAV
jgi:hypothetical protein